MKDPGRAGVKEGKVLGISRSRRLWVPLKEGKIGLKENGMGDGI